MARYIDADVLIQNITKIKDLRTLSTKTIGEAITNTPAADVVEVVRCKDCQYRYTANCNAKHERADMDYCSHGVRKEQEVRMNNANLKACPFCGGKAEVCIRHEDETTDVYVVKCMDCGATSTPEFFEDRAMKIWNDER